MGLQTNRNTIIALAVGIILAIVLNIAGVDWGPAFITGGLAAIVAWFVTQRVRGDTTNGQHSAAPTSAADIEALLATGTSAVSGFTSSAAEIANPATKEIAGKVGTNLSSIMTELQKPEKRDAVPVVIDNLVEPAQSVLTEYLFLTRKAIAAATMRATTIEQSIFPAIEAASRQTLSMLQEPGKPDIAKLTRTSAVPFEQVVTIPPSGTTPKGSREIEPNS